MKKSSQAAPGLVLLCGLMSSAFPALASESWTGAGGLASTIFTEAYSEPARERVAIFGPSHLVDTERFDVRILVALGSSSDCGRATYAVISAILRTGRSHDSVDDCRINWIMVLGSEAELRIPSDVVYDDAIVISEPTLGLFFIDSGEPAASPTFLLDDDARRVDSLEVLSSASTAAGRDFSDADLARVPLVHHRREWPERSGPNLGSLRSQVARSLAALFPRGGA